MSIATRRLRSAVLAAIASLTLAASAPAQTSTGSPASETFARSSAVQLRIDNFARVSDTYFRGAQPMGQDYADLKALGVTTIINLIGGDDVRSDEQASAERYGMRYVHIPMSTRRAPTAQELGTFFDAVDTADGAVYVHCVGGRHRTGVMTAVYRMTKDGLSGEQAFKEMKQFKYGPDFLHPEFKSFVYKYQVPKTAAVAAGTGQ